MIGYEYIPFILSWIASRGVLEVQKILTMDGTTFPKEAKPIICFLETFVNASNAAFVCSVAAEWSRCCGVQCLRFAYCLKG